jgi:hypothetical protein
MSSRLRHRLAQVEDIAAAMAARRQAAQQAEDFAFSALEPGEMVLWTSWRASIAEIGTTALVETMSDDERDELRRILRKLRAAETAMAARDAVAVGHQRGR